MGLHLDMHSQGRCSLRNLQSKRKKIKWIKCLNWKIWVWEANKWRPGVRGKRMAVVLNACSIWSSPRGLLGKRNTECSTSPQRPFNTVSGAWDSVFSRWFCSTVRTNNHWLLGFKDSVLLWLGSTTKGSQVWFSFKGHMREAIHQCVSDWCFFSLPPSFSLCLKSDGKYIYLGED